METQNALKEKQIEDLNNELSTALNNAGSINEQRLLGIRQILDKENDVVVNNYSNEIRNLSITSGVIAPFSLTLININELTVNIFFLLLGFSVLIFNIIISNYFLNKEVKKKDKKITQADINWILAKFENNTVKNKEEDTNQRVNSNFDILKNVSEIEKILGVGELKMDIQENKVSLRKYNKVSYVLFSIGSTLIVLSVIIKPVFEFLKKLALYLC